MKFFEICAEVLVPKFTRAEVRLPAHDKAEFPTFLNETRLGQYLKIPQQNLWME